MLLKKTIILSMIMLSPLSFSGPHKETMKNILEGAAIGTLIGTCSGCTCSPCLPFSWKTMAILACLNGAFTGFMNEDHSKPKKQRENYTHVHATS